jgi:hypothetical protein
LQWTPKEFHTFRDPVERFQRSSFWAMVSQVSRVREPWALEGNSFGV